MLQSIAAVLLFVACATAKSTYSTEASCQVSSWSPWGECIRTPVCGAESNQAHSFPMSAGGEDMGRVVMSMSRAEKEREWREEEDCRAAGTCPELALVPSEGRKDCKDGLAGRYPCKHVDMLSFLDFEALGHPQDIRQHANDIWGWTDPKTDDEYAISCLYGGVSFVRVTDPENPVVLGFLPTRTTPTVWHDAKVVNDHVYIVSEAAGHGMQVFDMTHLRNMTSFSQLKADAEYLEVGNSHNIVSHQETQTVFIVGASKGDYPNKCAGGLHMVDVSEPKNPRFSGCYAEDGYTHDAQCVIYHGPDTKYQGREVCFNYNENTLTIVDVTNRTNPKLISKRGYEDYSYTHQGWVTEDHTVLLLDDELDEKNNFADGRTRTHVWDISSLEDPQLKNTHISANTAIDHNQYIKGQFSYQSNYGAGLRILSIDQKKYQLNEVAYFDTLPSRTQVEFKGSWSNYPYFKSGNIVLGSIDYGLFMVRPRYADMEREVERNAVSGRQTRTRTITSTTSPEACPALEEARDCEPRGC